MVFALAVASFFAGGNLSSGEREDRGNRWVIVAFGVIGLLDAYLPAYTDRKEFWTIDGDAVRWIGVALFAPAVRCGCGRCSCSAHRFSGLVAIQPGHTLVTGGIYGVIRHPSYLGLLVNSLGWGLAFRSGAARKSGSVAHETQRAPHSHHPCRQPDPPQGAARRRARSRPRPPRCA